MRTFTDLIEELGELTDQDITAELNQTCRLKVNETMYVQLEVDPTSEFILTTVEISEIPPGRFRENILKDALKSNFLVEVNHSVLAYLGVDNKLILYEYIYAHALTGETLYEHIHRLVTRGEKWKNAIDSGQTSPNDLEEMPRSTESKNSSPFGF